MHELAVTEGILKVAVEAGQRAGASRITAINLVVGELASIVDDSVQFYFDILSRDTLAAQAQLRFRREPGRATCRDCGRAFAVRPPLAMQCPGCGSARLQVSGGREFFVESIEVENGDPGR
jgi:hydrogenase nickel incorporation protein HypA/HybF